MHTHRENQIPAKSLTLACRRLILAVFSITLACAADRPVDFRLSEAETGVVINGKPSSIGGHASGGAESGLWGRDQLLVLPIDPGAAAEAVLYVRSRPGPHDPASIEAFVGPTTARKPTDSGVRRIGSLVLLRGGAHYERYQWARCVIPCGLSAGPQQVLLTSAFDGPIGIDCIATSSLVAGGRWLPSDDFKDGKPVGEGRLMEPLALGQVLGDAPGNLFTTDEALGKPVKLRVSVGNGLLLPQKTTIRFELRSESKVVGVIATVPLDLPENTTVEVPLKVTCPGIGWWGIDAVIGEERRSAGAICVLRPTVRGLRPDSQFGIGWGPGSARCRAQYPELLARMGVKWVRGLDQGLDWPGLVSPAKGQWWTEAQKAAAVARVRKLGKSGISVLGFIGYNAPWNAKNPQKSWMSPPADLAVQAEIVNQLATTLWPDVRYWELWNEPGGHFWGGGADEWRAMLKTVWKRVKPGLPEVKLLSAGHFSHISRDWTFSQQHPDAGWVDGATFHPYGKPGLWTPSSPALEAAMVKRFARGKDGRLWITEVNAPGCWFHRGPQTAWPTQTARSVAPLYLGSQLGANGMPLTTFLFIADPGNRTGGEEFWFNLWEGEMPRPQVAAYAAMTAALEDCKLLGDAWVSSRLGFAPVYARPGGGSIAAIWPETTFPDESDEAGDAREVAIDLPAEGISQIWDHYGRPVGTLSTGGRLHLKAGTRAVHYLFSSEPAERLRERLRSARFPDRDLLRVRPQPMTRPVDDGAVVRVRVRNQSLQAQDVVLTVEPPADLKLATRETRTAALAPGAEWTASFAVTQGTPQATNRYPLAWTANVGGRTLRGNAEVQVACARFGTPAVDGTLKDWDTAVWSTIRQVGRLADWNKTKPSMLLGDGYRFAMQWDAKCLYLAAVLPDQTTRHSKQEFGLEYRIHGDDALSIGLRLLDANPDDLLRQHPLREKCLAIDIDYEFMSLLTSEGPRLRRMTAPGTAYQGDAPKNLPTKPALGDVAEAQVVVRYDEDRRCYIHEVSMPWALIPELGARLGKLAPGSAAEADFVWMVTDQHQWGTHTRFNEEVGDVEPAAYGLGWRVGTPCWKSDYPTRIRTAWGFVR